jgi:hypothetical protein
VQKGWGFSIAIPLHVSVSLASWERLKIQYMSHFECYFLNERYEADFVLDSNCLLKFLYCIELVSKFIICSQNQLSLKIKARRVLRHLLDAVFVLFTFYEIPWNIMYGAVLCVMYSSVRMNVSVTAGLCVCACVYVCSKFT